MSRTHVLGLTMVNVVTAVALTLPGTSATADAQVPYLPAPTGRDPVGSTSLWLKDTSRPDTWVPSVPYRELMVSVFYPAASSHGDKARYLTPEESAGLLGEEGIPGVEPEVLSTTITHSVRDAVPAVRRAHSLPLVVLSPGYTKPRAILTALAEDLASHGYVVALVGHTYENGGQSFPDGHFTGCASCEVPHDPAFWQKLELGRAADLSFVVDRLTGRWPGSPLIDRSRIGVAGHSVGGASAIPAMVADQRFKAGINIDGSTDFAIPDPGLSRPFMFMGHPLTPTTCEPGVRPSWERDWAQMTGWKRWLEVAGTQHASFTDLGLFADQFDLDFGQTTTGARTQQITRTTVKAFFDQHLRGGAGSLPSFPEVTTCR